MIRDIIEDMYPRTFHTFMIIENLPFDDVPDIWGTKGNK